MTHAPGYSFTYIESVIQWMHNRGLVVTPQDILTALWKLDAAGLPEQDAQHSLCDFLDRVSPSGTQEALNTWDGRHVLFDWRNVDLTGTDAEVSARYGHSNARVAMVMR
jgi:hypothetical protein